MGYIKHNAIVVTSWEDKAIEAAAQTAVALGMSVIGPSEPVTNGYRSILVCPDGSKEGWDTSDEGDERRAQFRKWLEWGNKDEEYGSFEWVEITYGFDFEDAQVVAHASQVD